MTKLDGKAVLVTGASGGLGHVVVEEFVRAGARVATADRHAHPHLSDKIVALTGDLLDEAAVEKIVAEADDRLGGLDAVLHLVGAWAGGNLSDTTTDTWRRMLSLNLECAFLVARAAVRRMQPRRRGRLVLVGAQAALGPAPGMAAYATAKAGLVAMARTLAEEVRAAEITVNVVLPSTIDTPANRNAMPDADPAKWVKPTEIAELMKYLISDEAAKITGAAIPIGR